MKSLYALMTPMFAATLSLLVILPAFAAEPFSLHSNDMTHGKSLSKAQEFKGFGCDGANLSPQLSWQNAPSDTKAFAITVYDPDAPTGSGWWHWQVVNIPANVNSIKTGAGNPDKPLLPKNSVQITNDYGVAGFGGACPPKGHGKHRYQFTVFALSQPLSLPDNASGALTGYMINSHMLASATLEAFYER